MDKILITGGSGLVGKEFLRRAKDKKEIYSLGRINPSIENINHIKCDLAYSFDIKDLPNKIDTVIHLAQSEHFREFPKYAENIFSVNTLSTLKLLEYARKANASTFVLASSGGIYGYGDDSFKEEDPILAKGDIGFYLTTKLCSEVLVENYKKIINIIILRFFFVYGPNQRESMLVPRLVKNVINGNPITISSKDGIRINPTFVTDAANAVLNSLSLNRSCKINVGGPDILSMKEIGEIIGEEVGKKPIFTIEDKPTQNLVGDISLMSNLLGQPKTHFREGIKELIKNIT